MLLQLKKNVIYFWDGKDEF